MYRNPAKNLVMMAITAFFSISFAATQSGGAPTEMLYNFWLNSDRGTHTDTGLETAGYRTLGVLIEGLSKRAADIGLTRKAIRNRVELQLLESGIRPVEANILERPYIYVQTNVVGSGFSINISFKRVGYFDSPPSFYRHVVTTWETGTTGTYVSGSAFILDSYNELLDAFLRDYLEANLGQN